MRLLESSARRWKDRAPVDGARPAALRGKEPLLGRLQAGALPFEEPMPLVVKFWGTRGSIPTPGAATQGYGGNTTCVELRADGAVFVCDEGPGLRELGVDLQRRFGEEPIVAHLFFSHPHWDHIQ